MFPDTQTQKIFSAPGHQRSKTRTMHLSEKSGEGFQFMSPEVEKIERESLNRRVVFLTEENQRLKSQLSAFEQEYEKVLKEKSEEMESFQMEKLESEMTVRSLREKYDEVLAELSEKKEENLRLSGEMEVLVSKLEGLARTQEKLKASNNSLSVKLERVQSNSQSMNKELETKHQKAQEGCNKKLAEVKAVYKKKLRLLKAELKEARSLSKELEEAEQRRLDAVQELENLKAKAREESSRMCSEHEEQMRRLEEDCEMKLNELEQQLDQRLRSENESFTLRFRAIQQENKELVEKMQEKERFFMRFKEDSEKDCEVLQKSLETLQKSNELQRRKCIEQQEKFSKDLERKQKEIDLFRQEAESFRSETEEKSRLSREELQRLVQRLQEKQQEISDLRAVLSQKMIELDSNFMNSQTLQAKISENRQLSFEKDSLYSEIATLGKTVEGLKAGLREAEGKVMDREALLGEEKEKVERLEKELEEKAQGFNDARRSLEANEIRMKELRDELRASLEAVKSLKIIENERNQAFVKIQELQQNVKLQERRFKEEVAVLNKEFEGRVEAKVAAESRRNKEIETKVLGLEQRERDLKGLLSERDAKLKSLSSKYQIMRERCLQILKFVRGNMKELRGIFGQLNHGVLIETLGLEIQEKLIAFSGVFTRKMASERNRIESFYTEERNLMKEKHQKEVDEVLMKIREKDQKLLKMSDEKVRKDQASLKELEGSNKELMSELSRLNSEVTKLRSSLKEKEKELDASKAAVPKLEQECKDLRYKYDKLEDLRSREKDKACKELMSLRGEIDDLYQRNKQIFDEFTVNISALKENQEQELKNINASYDDLIDVLKEKVKFYEENGQLLTQDYTEKCENLEKRNQELESQSMALKNFYEEQIELIQNKHSQVLFQNTMEADKNLRNLGIKTQEIERLEQKIRDLESLLKQKTLQIEELASKNSSIEGKLRNLQFQLELKTNHLNMKPVQISDELSKYNEEMMENPSVMPTTSFKSKHYSKTSGFNLNLPLSGAANEDKSEVFNKRINELKQLSQSISTNPLNTYKELPAPGEEDKRNELEGTIPIGNLHRYSKSSSNFLQYANKLVEKTNNVGFTSQREQREKTRSAEKQGNMHRNNQKSSLI